ncbi:MAG: glycosyltransferase family 9 protein [Bacteroidetes bacterium]|nr:glycosyltransferase family 9 protein [Bacteroidota bacterium]
MGRTRSSQLLKDAEIAIRRAFIRWLSSRSEPEQPGLPLELGETPTILFLRQDRLGDAIITTPLLVAMRRRYPHAKFIVLLGENNKDIAPLLPIEAEIVIYRKRPLEDIEMLRKLRRRTIDVVVDLMDNPSATSSMLIAAIGARYSVGVEKDNAPVYNIRVPLIDRGKYHITRRIAELLRPFGIDPETVDLKAVLRGLNVQPVAGRFGLNISAGHPDREMLTSTFAGVAKAIREHEWANEVILMFHPRDKARAEAIAAEAGTGGVTLGPVTKSFREFAELLGTCKVVITPDTSAVHVCSALGIPVVAAYMPMPPTLHYWTPVGVDFEMIVPNARDLTTLPPEPIISAIATLVGRLHHAVTTTTNSPAYVA